MHRQRVVDEHDESVGRILHRGHWGERFGVELLVSGAGRDAGPHFLRGRAKLLALPLAPEHAKVTAPAVVSGVLQVQQAGEQLAATVHVGTSDRGAPSTRWGVNSDLTLQLHVCVSQVDPRAPPSHGPQAGDVGKLVIFAHVLTGCRVIAAASAVLGSIFYVLQPGGQGVQVWPIPQDALGEELGHFVVKSLRRVIRDELLPVGCQ
mmetsp:Transcript_4554/g.11232  ORF Transcript_4554/g.11232 Transcript_4554/m.11232 type:complete len:206 (+) Transcript_4554:347-964(+)